MLPLYSDTWGEQWKLIVNPLLNCMVPPYHFHFIRLNRISVKELVFPNIIATRLYIYIFKDLYKDLSIYYIQYKSLQKRVREW